MAAGQQVRAGTAGWSIPRSARHLFPEDGTSLERYAARLNAAEINSSFHRSHRPAIYERWAASVPATFRFAVKLPKTITHGSRLVACEPLLEAFRDEIAPLGTRRGPVLVQLPPSLAFDEPTASRFFEALAELVGGPAVVEPRHASWFEPAADALLVDKRVARVVADPLITPGGAEPGGWRGLAYYRLHGSPRTYWSSYEADRLTGFAREVSCARASGAECWVIFDNTAGGGAAGNALAIRSILGSD